VNVLGMPPKPAGVVLNQRRMSYDTATGSYMLVTRYEQEQERLAAQKQQQQGEANAAAVVLPLQLQEQLQEQLPQQPPAVHPAASSMQAAQLQQHTGVEQQLSLHVQLPEAELQPLQCNVGSSGSPEPSPSPVAQQMNAHVQRLVAALARKGLSTSLLDSSADQQQQQQQGAGIESFSSSGDNAAAAQLQPEGVAQAAAAQQPHRQSSAATAAPQVPRPRYTAKVCDFGFSQCLRAGQSHCSTAAAGTITHQAPEVLQSGHLSPAADIYAFGIIRKWLVLQNPVCSSTQLLYVRKACGLWDLWCGCAGIHRALVLNALKRWLLLG
jgi:hypothetical protein